jgi:hypothetical protein
MEATEVVQSLLCMTVYALFYIVFERNVLSPFASKILARWYGTLFSDNQI